MLTGFAASLTAIFPPYCVNTPPHSNRYASSCFLVRQKNISSYWLAHSVSINLLILFSQLHSYGHGA
jgi:hypothetical protein